jgi:hypothetical protein
MNKYAAMLWPLLGGVVMALLQAYQAATGDGVTPSEWVTVIIQGATVLTVWLAANIRGYTKVKPLVAGVMLVLNLLVTLIVGGIDGNEATQLAIAFLGAIGVFVTPGPVHAVTNEVPTRVVR